MKDSIFDNEIEMLERLIGWLGRHIPDTADKTVYCMHRGQKRFYYLVENGVRTYVPEKRYDELKPVIQAEYYRKLLACARKRLSVLMRAGAELEMCRLEDVYDGMKDCRKALIQKKTCLEALEDEQVQFWLRKRPICYNDTIGKIFPTDRGEKVRSKSEVLIANRLYREGIPYRYEFAVETNVMIRFPDFMILNVRTGEEYYLEHLGRTGDPNYMAANLEKLEEYAKIGIVLGKNLLLTFESEGWPYTGCLLDDYIRLFFK